MSETTADPPPPVCHGRRVTPWDFFLFGQPLTRPVTALVRSFVGSFVRSFVFGNSVILSRDEVQLEVIFEKK